MKTKYACYYYSITQFVWDKISNTFIVGEKDLEFPRLGKQFVINNPITNEFRRFRLSCRRKNNFQFKSYDGIRVIVLKGVSFV